MRELEKTFASFKSPEDLLSLKSSLLSRSLSPTGTLLCGDLNQNFILSDPSNRLFVLRIAKKDLSNTLSRIHKMFTQTGFLSSGGSYRYRSISEQANFSISLHMMNLKVILPVCFGEEWMITPFVEGQTFKEYLTEGKIAATKLVLANLISSHLAKVVYGDRWTPNTIVSLDGDITELDFDIQLTGSYSKEFDLCQLLFYILLFSSNRSSILKIFKQCFGFYDLDSIYNINVLTRFISLHAKYSQHRRHIDLNEQHQKNIINWTPRLIELLNSKKSGTQYIPNAE